MKNLRKLRFVTKLRRLVQLIFLCTLPLPNLKLILVDPFKYCQLRLLTKRALSLEFMSLAQGILFRKSYLQPLN